MEGYPTINIYFPYAAYILLTHLYSYHALHTAAHLEDHGSKVSVSAGNGQDLQGLNVYKERFLVAHTTDSLIVGDLEAEKIAEVPWGWTGSEKFDFDTERVCVVHSRGEVSVVEYGVNRVLGNRRKRRRMASRRRVMEASGPSPRTRRPRTRPLGPRASTSTPRIAPRPGSARASSSCAAE